MRTETKSFIWALAGSLLLGSAFSSQADGTLYITNSVVPTLNPRVELRHNAAATDLWDGSPADEYQTLPATLGYPDIYSKGLNPNFPFLAVDTRNNASRTPFTLHSVLNHPQITKPITNYLKLGFGPLGNFPENPDLTLREITNGVPTGKAWDVRQVIASSNGVVQVGVIAPGSYDGIAPYQSFRLDFEPLLNPVLPVLHVPRFVDFRVTTSGRFFLVTLRSSPGFKTVLEQSMALPNFTPIETNNISFEGDTNMVETSFLVPVNAAEMRVYRLRSGN